MGHGTFKRRLGFPVRFVPFAAAARFALLALTDSSGANQILGPFSHDHSGNFHSGTGPGNAGDIHQKRLEEQLARETPTGHVGNPNEGFVLKSGTAEESVQLGATCPSDTPVREYNVVAINVVITLNRFLDHDPHGRMFVLEEESARVRREEAQNRTARGSSAESAVSLGLQGDAIQPLTIRVNQGECLRVNLTNNLVDRESASLHIHGSGLYVADTGEPSLATNPDAMVAPNETVRYEWWVEEELEGTHYLRSHGNTRKQTSHGLFGAIIVHPVGATFTHPVTGEDHNVGWKADVHLPSGSSYRHFSLLFQDEDQIIGTQVMPYRDRVRGVVGLNYTAEPLEKRLKENIDTSKVFRSDVHGNPATPVMESFLGDPLKIHFILPSSEQNQVFTLEGHQWPLEPGMPGSDLLSSVQVGALEAITIVPEYGAGGRAGFPGDYLYGNHREPYRGAGLWGIFRVHAPEAADTGLLPLSFSTAGSTSGNAQADATAADST